MKKKSDPSYLFSPPFIILLFYSYYFIISPIFLVFYSNTYYVGRDFRDLMINGWVAGILGFSGSLFGFFLVKIRSSTINSIDIPSAVMAKWGLWLLELASLGLFVWIYFGGATINLLIFTTNTENLYTENLQTSKYMYFYAMLNLAIPGLTLLYYSHKNRIIFTIWLIAFVFIFTVIGFRYRLLVIFISLFSSYCLKNRIRPQLSKMLIGALIVSSFFSLIGLVRDYSSGGLNIEKMDNIMDLNNYVASFFSEANTFFGLSALVDFVPTNKDYLYLSPFLYVFILPIPRFLWQDKPFPQIFEYIVAALDTNYAANAGTAIPYIGEYYIAFGWIGILLGSVAFGALSKFMWVKYCYGRDKSRADYALYSVYFSFIYYWMSRGYSAQIVQDFMFIIFPVILMRLISRHRIKKSN